MGGYLEEDPVQQSENKRDAWLLAQGLHGSGIEEVFRKP
jgi:hypothetical protein